MYISFCYLFLKTKKKKIFRINILIINDDHLFSLFSSFNHQNGQSVPMDTLDDEDC